MKSEPLARKVRITRCVMKQVAIIVKTQGEDVKIYGSNIKVLSQITCIQKPYHLPFKRYGQSSSFSKKRQTSRSRSQGQKLWYH
jgi:hypothetical protein